MKINKTMENTKSSFYKFLVLFLLCSLTKQTTLVAIHHKPSQVNSQKKELVAINGSSDMNDAHFNEVMINGSLNFNNLTVEKNLNINGNGSGKNLKCKTLQANGSFNVVGLKAHDIEVNGSLSGQDINIIEQTKISGSVEISDGQLNNVELASQNATFNRSKINGNLSIKKTSKQWWKWWASDQYTTQIIKLKEGSEVLGDIAFEQPGGEVHLFDGSSVKGEIQNGKIIKK